MFKLFYLKRIHREYFFILPEKDDDVSKELKYVIINMEI